MDPRYPNGELVTTASITSEPWYSDYQTMMELAARDGGETNVSRLLDAFMLDYREVHGSDFPDGERALRWAILHAERQRVIGTGC